MERQARHLRGERSAQPQLNSAKKIKRLWLQTFSFVVMRLKIAKIVIYGMYIPRRYEEKDLEKVHAFIRENSFAILVTVLDGLPVATHIPLLLEKDGQG